MDFSDTSRGGDLALNEHTTNWINNNKTKQNKTIYDNDTILVVKILRTKNNQNYRILIDSSEISLKNI